MKTYSRLILAFLLLVFVVPQVVADEPPENGPHIEYHENGKKKLEEHYKDGKRDGLWTEWYDSGQKWWERHYKDGKKDGLYTSWHENGQKRSEAHYKDGKKDGPGTWWYENGQKESESHWKDGKLDGLWTGWHKNGQKKLEGHYKNGKRDGLWTGWHKNGQKKLEGHYKKRPYGKLDGLETRWFENGQKRSESHWKDGKVVSVSAWQPDGELCPVTKVVDGSGIAVTYHDNGQKAWEYHYKDGEPDGLETGWHKNGQKAAEGHYKNGKLDGLYTRWHENGQKSEEGHYKNGKSDGLVTVWYTNGQKKSEWHVRDGKQDGLYTRWHENGQKRSESHWKDGKRDGRWTEWDENGQKLSEIHYKYGKLDGLETFDDSFSDFETSDARQILADTQAKRVAEAAKQNALIYFVISLVICYVIFPINDQRLLKVVIVIGVTTIGYFGGQWIEERKGIDTDPMLAAEERADAKKAEALLDKAVKKMQLTGLDVSGLEQVEYSVDRVQKLKRITLSSKNVRAFQDQLYDFVPTLQSLVDEIAQNSMSMAEFDGKFRGMGDKFLGEMSDITGANYGELRGQVESTIRDRTIRSPSGKALAAQAAADQLFEWGYSEVAIAPDGALSDVQTFVDRIDIIKGVRKQERTVARGAAAKTASKKYGFGKASQDELVMQRTKLDAALGEENAIEKLKGTINPATKKKWTDEEIGKLDKDTERDEMRQMLRDQLENALGGEVSDKEVTDAYAALKDSGKDFKDWIADNQKDRIAKGEKADIEIDHSQAERAAEKLYAGGLTPEQVTRLLDYNVAVRQRIAELNYALEGIKDHAGVQSAGGIRAIVDRKVEQTKSTPQKNP